MISGVQPYAVDHAQTRHGVMCAADRGHPCVIMSRALRGVSQDHTAAATKLLIKLLLEGLAQQVKGKRVEAGVGECQDTSNDAADKVNQGSVHLVVRGERITKRVHKKKRNRGV